MTSATLATPALAQVEGTLLQPSIPSGFDRGRNVSVQERRRPDYDPTGIQRGSFDIFPRIDLGIGASDNVYATDAFKRSDGFASIVPSVLARTNWERNQIILRGGARLERYFTESPRNQNAWNLGALGRLDVSSQVTVTGEAQLAREYENIFTGAVDADVAVLSSYLRGFANVRAEYEAGRTHLIGSVDRTSFDFSKINPIVGSRIDQSDRDRDVTRVTGQAEYALSPTIAVYGQLGYARTDYERLTLGGLPNRDSDAVRGLIGTNFDLAGLARGTIGVGYVTRSYDSPLYRNVSGLSVEALVEWFPSELTTVGLRASRILDDSSINNNSAYFNNLASFRIDHELLRNLILTGTAEVARQDYVGIALKATSFRFAGAARYSVSRSFGINGTLSYGGRRVDQIDRRGSDFDEVRGLIGLTFQR